MSNKNVWKNISTTTQNSHPQKKPNPNHQKGKGKNNTNTTKESMGVNNDGLSKNCVPEPVVTSKNNDATLEKFEEIQKKNLRKAKEFAEEYNSSSDEEDLNTNDLLSTIFKKYFGETTQVSKTQTFIENFLQSGSIICLICIGSVKRNDGVWSCKSCYCIFHLNCIKRWGNDSIAQQKLYSDQEQGYYNNDGEYIPKKNKPIRWYCPKCRKENSPADIPKFYECFCGKEINPQNHPWLIPHSCGEQCGKYLDPNCGHTCLLLCHPGPCPPCPQTVSISCKCGRSPPKFVRCFQKIWSCNSKCLQTLPCGIHKCGSICHEAGKCPPCNKKSKQKCQCEAEVDERNCCESIWQCKKVCNKLLPCGIHKCKKICHAGDCGSCSLGLPRTCPCGKTKSVAPCTEAIETCGDTCQKLLACGEHYCTMRCHKNECSPCLTIVQKKCRCGLHTKELPCSKVFSCETKCKRLRECEKHACNKKCCDGQCPPCDKICNKTLSCKKHKCKSICHDGPCYPCELKSQIKCRCGSAVIIVPCGRERRTRPPKCRKPCRIPSKCHHQNAHNCHMDECPPCNKKCELRNDTTNCDHPCEAKCHDAVKVPVKKKSNNIWDWNQENFEYKKLPHPRCEIKVMVTCLGGHETCLWPCWNSKPTSCQKICGRLLNCKNHYCQKICHTVSNLEDMNEQIECARCEEECKLPRPEGCSHACKKPCHPPPCQKCNFTIKTNCHCGLSQVFYKCSEFYDLNLSKDELQMVQEKLKCCGNRCIRNYPCGHRCTLICHSGICSNPENCKKKMKIYCECKNLKTDITCEKYRNGFINLQCDETCLRKKEHEDRIRQQREEIQRKAEEEKNRLELEMFEKKFGKKKYKERKNVEKIQEKNDYHKILWIGSGALLVIMSILIFIYSAQ